MKLNDKIILQKNLTIRDGLKILENNGLQFGLVLGEGKKLIGTVTDGDIRRGLLKGKELTDRIEEVMQNKPFAVEMGADEEEIKRLLKKRKLKFIPIINSEKKLIDVIVEDDGKKKRKENEVIIMAGGLGTRLWPLTKECPKPMLDVNGKPILELILNKFIEQGYENFTISVNYKKEIIKEYFKDGESFDVRIKYIEESKRMGTGGALTLLKEKINNSFFVVNGDVLTDIDYGSFQIFHENKRSIATMGVRNYVTTIPYGVVSTKKNIINGILEKPEITHQINSGIYMLSPECLDYMPKNEYFDLPELFKILAINNKKTYAYTIHGNWIDVGRMDDLEKARGHASA